MNTDKKYYAFISYKREDEKWAVWLQNKLEHYKLPSNLNGRTDLPKEIRPVFRDKSELAGGVLADEIQSALEASKYLIVICSPRAAQSPWVGKEVQSFVDMGRTDKIIPFIIGGTAHAHNPEDECFPLALLNLPPDQELLGININEMGRDAAAVKVVAQMFGLKFDALWQRWEREQRRKRNRTVRGVVLLAIVAIGVAGWIWWQNVKLKEKDWKMMENQSRFGAEKAIALAAEDSYLARLLAIDILPKNLEHPERPYTPEGEKALRETTKYNTAILRGHSNTVKSVFFNHDGSKIISASNDGTIKVWEAESGILLNSWEANLSFLDFPIALSANGKQIASTSYFIDYVYIWDIESGEKLDSLRCVLAHSVAFSPNGEQVVATSKFDNSIRVWNLKNGKELVDFHGHFNEINAIAFRPDGKQIVSASADNTIRIWDLDSGKELLVIDGHDNIHAVAFSPDGKTIVSASSDSTVRTWNSDNGKELLVMRGHTSHVVCATFSPDGNRIASASVDGTIRIWDSQNGLELLVMGGHSSYVNSVAFHPDGKRIVSASDDGTIRIWDIDTISKQKEIGKHAKTVNSIAFSPDGKLVVSASEDETIGIWDIESCYLHKQLKGHHNSVISASFNLEGNLIVSASLDSTAIIWDAETGAKLCVLKGDSGLVYSAAFSPDGKHVITSAPLDGYIRLWEIETGTEVGAFETVEMDPAFHVIYSQDGKYVISSHNSNIIRIWDAKSRELLKSLGDGYDLYYGVFSVDVNSDGKRIVSTSMNGNICIWDAETCVRLFELKGPSEPSQACFSPNDKFVISAFWDGTIIIWDASTGTEVQTFKGDGTPICSVAFSPDGRQIVSASSDGAIRIWPFPPLQELIDQTRERFKDRPLTPEERHQYYLE